MSKCNDEWKGDDKELHFLVCALIAIFSPILAVMSAVGKELYDRKQNGNHFCWKDILADVCGIITGSFAHVFLVWTMW